MSVINICTIAYAASYHINIINNSRESSSMINVISTHGDAYYSGSESHFLPESWSCTYTNRDGHSYSEPNCGSVPPGAIFPVELTDSNSWCGGNITVECPGKKSNQWDYTSYLLDKNHLQITPDNDTTRQNSNTIDINITCDKDVAYETNCPSINDALDALDKKESSVCNSNQPITTTVLNNTTSWNVKCSSNVIESKPFAIKNFNSAIAYAGADLSNNVICRYNTPKDKNNHMGDIELTPVRPIALPTANDYWKQISPNSLLCSSTDPTNCQWIESSQL